MPKKICKIFLLMVVMLLMSSCLTVETQSIPPDVPLDKTGYHEDEAGIMGAEYDHEEEKLLAVVHHSISDNMDEFIFEFHYRMRVLNEHNPNVASPVIYTVNISNQNGEIIQTLYLGYRNAQLGGDYFIDANFDGFLDLKLVRPEAQSNPLRWGIGWRHYYFLWNDEIEQFVLNEQLIELEEYGFWRATEDFRTDLEQPESGNSDMHFDSESQMLIFSSALSGSWFYFPPMERHIPSQHIRQYYQYVDGKFTLIRIQEMLYDWYGIWRVRDLDTETGIEIITYIESEN